jgi:hypothetical protein
MHRDNGRGRALRVVLMAVLIALAFTTVAIGFTHADALADWSWGAGPGLTH